jgi:F0F1-type ATP synthase assembly protein I
VTGIGFEFAAAIAGLTLVGYWVDRYLGSFPAGLLIGIGLGLVGGGYNLIRASLSASRDAEREHKEERDRQSKV